MIIGIVTKLKTGTIKRVIPYGCKLPSPPYIVVKEENDILNRGTAYRVIVHFPKDDPVGCKRYCRKDVSDLLSNFEFTDSEGVTNGLEFDQFNGVSELTVDNDNGTISSERVFYKPDLMF